MLLTRRIPASFLHNFQQQRQQHQSRLSTLSTQISTHSSTTTLPSTNRSTTTTPMKRNIVCISSCQYKIPTTHDPTASRKTKFEYLNEILLSRHIVSPHQVIMQPEMVSVGDLKRVHDPEYVDSFIHNTMSRQMLKKIGVGLTSSTGTIDRQVYERVMYVVGATVQASYLAMEHGRAANLAGGAHHAYYDSGGGYCVFNDIVVAGESLVANGHIERYLVIDLDVHQGDGTASMLQGAAAAGGKYDHTFTFSMHGAKNFPMVKQRSSWDVALEDGTNDETYLDLLDKCLRHMLKNRSKSFRYDYVFYQAGVDVLAGDGLGRLALSMDGVRQRDALVSQFITHSSCPVSISLGGGYAKGDHTAEVVATAHAQTIEMMSREDW